MVGLQLLGIVFNVLYAQFYKKPLVHSCFLDLQPAVLGRHILFFQILSLDITSWRYWLLVGSKVKIPSCVI